MIDILNTGRVTGKIGLELSISIFVFFLGFRANDVILALDKTFLSLFCSKIRFVVLLDVLIGVPGAQKGRRVREHPF